MFPNFSTPRPRALLRALIIGGIGGVLGLNGCAAPAQKTIDADTPKLGTYSAAEVREQAEALLRKMQVRGRLGRRILSRLDELLADPQFAANIESPGINAVGAFQAGGGGIIVRAAGGHGLVNFAGGSQEVKFETQGFSVGANLGGESTYGVLVAVGLEYEEKFPDKYKVVATGATAAETSYRVGRGTAERGGHRVHWVGSGGGISGDAGVGRATITLVE